MKHVGRHSQTVLSHTNCSGIKMSKELPLWKFHTLGLVIQFLKAASIKRKARKQSTLGMMAQRVSSVPFQEKKCYVGGGKKSYVLVLFGIHLLKLIYLNFSNVSFNGVWDSKTSWSLTVYINDLKFTYFSFIKILLWWMKLNKLKTHDNIEFIYRVQMLKEIKIAHQRQKNNSITLNYQNY